MTEESALTGAVVVPVVGGKVAVREVVGGLVLAEPVGCEAKALLVCESFSIVGLKVFLKGENLSC